jgi:hypothetical protein
MNDMNATDPKSSCYGNAQNTGGKPRPAVGRPLRVPDPKAQQTTPFDIVFHGLFCHLTEENTVIMIQAHEHELRLVVRDDAVVSATGLPQDFVHAEAGEHSYVIMGRKFAIGGAQGTDTTMTAEFKDHVPSVAPHSQKTAISADVEARKVNGDVAGYLEHTGGEYAVIDYFPDMAQFDDVDDEPDCVARKVRFRIASAGDVTFDAGNGAGVTVKAGSTVRFENVPAEGSAPPNEHFHHYYMALFGSQGAALNSSANAQHCGIAAAAAFPGADCANSHHP